MRSAAELRLAELLTSGVGIVGIIRLTLSILGLLGTRLEMDKQEDSITSSLRGPAGGLPTNLLFDVAEGGSGKTAAVLKESRGCSRDRGLVGQRGGLVGMVVVVTGRGNGIGGERGDMHGGSSFSSSNWTHLTGLTGWGKCREATKENDERVNTVFEP